MVCSNGYEVSITTCPQRVITHDRPPPTALSLYTSCGFYISSPPSNVTCNSRFVAYIFSVLVITLFPVLKNDYNYVRVHGSEGWSRVVTMWLRSRDSGMYSIHVIIYIAPDRLPMLRYRRRRRRGGGSFAAEIGFSGVNSIAQGLWSGVGNGHDGEVC